MRYFRGIKFLVAVLGWFSFASAQMTVRTAWSEYVCDDEVAERIIASPVMQRMKDIAVAGPTYYLGMVPEYSRFNHCVGVWWLLKEKTNASTKEQLAGLMHDASHTVFSHLGDIVFGKGDGDKSYQDTIHLWFLSHYKDLIEVLEQHNFTLDQMDPDHAEYQALEQPLPDLCADRIEYNIHTGVAFSKITKEEACELVDALVYQDGHWFFTNEQAAYQFARLPIHFTYTTWGSPYNVFVYHCFSHIIKQALVTGLLTHDTMHFGGDSDVMQIITTSTDPVIQGWLERAKNCDQQYALTEYGQGVLNVRPKCRAVDPLVQTAQGLCRLSELHLTFARELHEVQQWCKTGYGLTFEL